jgi:hypothetical protein
LRASHGESLTPIRSPGGGWSPVSSPGQVRNLDDREARLSSEGDDDARARLAASEAEVASLKRCEADLRARLAASEAEVASLRAYTGKRGAVSSHIESAGGSSGEAVGVGAGSERKQVEEGLEAGEEDLRVQLRFAEMQLQATREILAAHDRALGTCPCRNPPRKTQGRATHLFASHKSVGPITVALCVPDFFNSRLLSIL